MSNKAEPTVRWGVTFNCQGRRVRLKGGLEAAKYFATTSRVAAMAEAAKLCRDHEDPRIVKLTRRARPKVVAKSVIDWPDAKGTMWGSALITATHAVRAWFDEHSNPGTRVRITLEELES